MAVSLPKNESPSGVTVRVSGVLPQARGGRSSGQSVRNQGNEYRRRFSRCHAERRIGAQRLPRG